jgi:hypothetical protein
MIPPSKAWEELEGIPLYQVIRLHTIAEAKATARASTRMDFGSTRSWPMVVATATPKAKGATNSAKAARAKALPGLIALEEMASATMLALSWKPFRKAKIKASRNTAITLAID